MTVSLMTQLRSLASLMLCVAPLLTQAQSPLQVPQGLATIDGNLDDAEWRNALRIESPPGTRIHVMRDASHLYVGVISERPGFMSVCVTNGDDVHVLHASAALGAVTYRRNGDTWSSADTAFRYGMRNTALDDAARAQRSSYLGEHGWVASTVRMGNEGRSQEMQIAFSRFAAPFSLAVSRWLSSGGLEVWPTTVSQGDHDGCAASQLVRGYVPQGLRFFSMNWVAIRR